MDSFDEGDLIRFRCEECGKLLGAMPGMRIVVCPQCRLDNSVPSQGEMVGSLLEAAYRPAEVRPASLDIPLSILMRFGVKVAIAAIPLVCLLALAACGVIAIGSSFRERPPAEIPLPVERPPVVENVEPVQPELARPGWAGFLGVILLLTGSLFMGGFFLGLSDRTTEPKRLPNLIAFVFVCLGPFLIGAGLCWWYFR